MAVGDDFTLHHTVGACVQRLRSLGVDMHLQVSKHVKKIGQKMTQFDKKKVLFFLVSCVNENNF